MNLCPLENLSDPQPSFVALGTFDGLHIGHRQVICATVERAELLPTVVSVIPSHKPEGFLTTPEENHALLAQMGVAQYVPLPLEAIRHLSPEEFFRDILIRRLSAKQLACGFNFRFGKNAAGDTALLEKMCRQAGVGLTVIPPVTLEGQPVSSSRIREALAAGDPGLAAQLLGRPYGFCLPVTQGQRLGRKLGFPTINQPLPSNLTCPRLGVYAVKVTVEGASFAGVCNIGLRPTVGDIKEPLAETHIIGFEGNAYQKSVEVRLVEFLREEKRFSDLEELQKAIRENVEQAKAIVSLSKGEG